MVVYRNLHNNKGLIVVISLYIKYKSGRRAELAFLWLFKAFLCSITPKYALSFMIMLNDSVVNIKLNDLTFILI